MKRLDAPCRQGLPSVVCTTSTFIYIIPLTWYSFFWMELRIHSDPNHIFSFSSSTLTRVASLAFMSIPLPCEDHHTGSTWVVFSPPQELDRSYLLYGNLLRWLVVIWLVGLLMVSPPFAFPLSLELPLLDDWNSIKKYFADMAFIRSCTPRCCNSYLADNFNSSMNWNKVSLSLKEGICNTNT